MYYSYTLSYIPVELVDLAHEEKEFIQNNEKMEGVIVQSHRKYFYSYTNKELLLIFWA